MNNNGTVININNLDHYFGKGELRKQILFEINLTLKAGEVVILKGPSGSGKTTLLTLMGGLRSPQTGSLKVLGKELVGAKKNQLVKLRRNIGYIFQSHNLLECLTARQNVAMSLELHSQYSRAEIKQKTQEILEAVG
ncbi:MAG: ATP-binding cassette domain-containing protein, partial [Crocosphaera sp.]